MQTNQIILALDKAVDSKLKSDARENIEAGEYDVEFIAKIAGKLKVGEDYEQRIVAKANPWALVAILMSKVNNVTLQSVVRQALESGATGENVKTVAEAAMADLKDVTVQTCKGKITAKLQIQVTELIDQLEHGVVEWEQVK